LLNEIAGAHKDSLRRPLAAKNALPAFLFMRVAIASDCYCFQGDPFRRTLVSRSLNSEVQSPLEALVIAFVPFFITKFPSPASELHSSFSLNPGACLNPRFGARHNRQPPPSSGPWHRGIPNITLSLFTFCEVRRCSSPRRPVAGGSWGNPASLPELEVFPSPRSVFLIFPAYRLQPWSRSFTFLSAPLKFVRARLIDLVRGSLTPISLPFPPLVRSFHVTPAK